MNKEIQKEGSTVNKAKTYNRIGLAFLLLGIGFLILSIVQFIT